MRTWGALEWYYSSTGLVASKPGPLDKWIRLGSRHAGQLDAKYSQNCYKAMHYDNFDCNMLRRAFRHSENSLQY